MMNHPTSKVPDSDATSPIDSDRPAILGGRPVFPHGPPDWPGEMPEVTAALVEALRDGSWGRYEGPHVAALEDSLGQAHRCRVLTCSSGTLGVELALRALGVSATDRVVLAAYDYEGNFLAVHACQAQPVLVDVTAQITLDLNQLEATCRTRPKALIVSHLHGSLQPMREVREMSDRYGVAVIEDAAQAIGAVVQGQPAGTWGDIGVVSFGGSKLLSAGRGGALLTGRDDLYHQLRRLLRRGVQWWSALSELQAAALRPQWSRLPQRHAQRAAAVAWLDQALAPIPGLHRVRSDVPGSPAYYKVAYRVDASILGIPRDRWIAAMHAEGMAWDAAFRALHVGRSQRRFETMGLLSGAESLHQELTVLHHPVLLQPEETWSRIAEAVYRLYCNRDRLLSV